MAESAVLVILRPVIDKLGQLLFEEANLFKHVHREVKSLTDELETIQCFLKEAGENAEMRDGVKTWVKQVREEAYRIEDVMDEYLLHVAQHRHQRSGFIGFLQKIGHSIKAMRPRYNIASEIQNIKASLSEIKDRGERYGFNSLEQQSRGEATNVERKVDPRLGSHFIDESELVGIGSLQDELTRWLIQGTSQRSVITLVGAGGIGKTTLARKLYDNEVVRRNFNCRAWMNVSQSYNMEQLLSIMKKKIFPANESTSEESRTTEELIRTLRKYLKTKRYMVIFDDVWQVEFWEFIKHVVPSNNQGSRVIVTTRSDAIAASCKETSCDLIHKLLPWSLENSLELFCKKAFQSEFDGRCPQELEELSFKIVEKCKGLPLVIAAVAGLLSTKTKDVSEWQKMSDCLSSELETNPRLSRCSKILSLSYEDLSYQLKPCFLSFGMFPKNHQIPHMKLYGKWVTEGFVKERRSQTVKQVAVEILTELIERNLVQSWEASNGLKYCQVHDLMHEIILSKATDLGFSEILDEKSSSIIVKTRRLSICSNKRDISEAVKDSGVRSILFHNVDNLTSSVLVAMFEKFKLLKVLDFENADLDYLPEELGNLFHLSYLSLLNTKVKMLPKSIGKLQNLKILDIRDTLVHKLPKEINKLRSLRHLLANSRDKTVHDTVVNVHGVTICEGIGNLEDLQTLLTMEASPERVGIIKEFEKLKQLRSLAISKLTADIGRLVCTAIEKMNYLESLALHSIDNDEILDLQLTSPPRLLGNLVVESRIQQLPDWIPKLQCLRTLNLSLSRLTDDPLKCLLRLPNLECLWLYKAYEGKQLHFEENGFRKLKRVSLRDLEGLEVVTIGKGALPLLEHLDLGPSQLLKELPSDVQHLKSLTSLKLYDMPKQFVFDLQPEGGQDHWKVKNVPYVCFSYRVEVQRYQVYKLGDSSLLEHLQH